jgi:outer membrane receptor protein involved in Fe transport
MNLKTLLMFTVASVALIPGLALAAPAALNDASASGDAPTKTAPAASMKAGPVAPAAPIEEAFTTGVAKGRDRLDSATSTSALKESEIQEFGAHSLAEILQNIPGIHAESQGGEGNGSYSIRGLPLAATGSKYMQFEEDGLPVLEYGDMTNFAPDMFVRNDLNVAQIETIRGGSASTFASNSPGGVINLISKTGEVQGGEIALTEGLDYGENRIDADYGAKLSDTLRFHIGGFFRDGEGPRTLGYNAYSGGQLKFNVTQTFANGYIRLYGKYLDDHTPYYEGVPIRVTGTNSNPTYSDVPGVDMLTGSLQSRNNLNVVALDDQNHVRVDDMEDGMHAVDKSAGLESQFDFGAWTVSEKFRFSAISGSWLQNEPIEVAPAGALAYAFGGPGGSLSYANGPMAGQTIGNPATLNGNGLLALSIYEDAQANSLQNITNDVRLSRVWTVGDGELTGTAGFYSSSQDYDMMEGLDETLSDVAGGGNAALINVTTAGGFQTTQNGYLSYGVGSGLGDYHRLYEVNYGVEAPYGSLNYHLGRLAVGASARFDMDSANGNLYGSDLGGGRIGTAPVDVNGDGKISPPESQTDVLPLGQPGKVDYSSHYPSYSVSANYHIIDPLAVFARYSVGGRGDDDKILFTPAVNVAGGLADPASGFDVVKQTELGLKFREGGFTINATGFTATTGERNIQVTSNAAGQIQVENIDRGYSAKGVEVEAGSRIIARPITTLTSAMAQLAKGDNEIAVDADRADELGDMARAVLVFRDTALAKAEADKAKARAEMAKAEADAAKAEADAAQRQVVENLSTALQHLAPGDLTHSIAERFPAEYEACGPISTARSRSSARPCRSSSAPRRRSAPAPTKSPRPPATCRVAPNSRPPAWKKPPPRSTKSPRPSRDPPKARSIPVRSYRPPRRAPPRAASSCARPSKPWA